MRQIADCSQSRSETNLRICYKDWDQFGGLHDLNHTIQETSKSDFQQNDSNHATQWRSQDYYEASAKKKNCNTFTGVYIRNCKQIIIKSKEIVQFIRVYIRNLEELDKNW